MSMIPPHREFSAGTLFVATQTKATLQITKPLLVRNLHGSTSIDRAIQASTSLRLPAARDVIVAGSALYDEFLIEAKRLNPRSQYERKQAPDAAELAPLTRYRFRRLESHLTGLKSPAGTTLGAVTADVLRLINHITIDDITCAFETIAQNAANLGKANQAFRRAWNRDLNKVRKAFKDKTFRVSAEFSKNFEPLVKNLGDLEAVCAVLEQAFEFEHTCEYLAESLRMIKSVPGNDMEKKGSHFSDLSANQIYLADAFPKLLREGDANHNAHSNLMAIMGLRLERNGVTAPEGERWHRILGFTSLEYVLHYLFSTADRFKSFGMKVTLKRPEVLSACFLVAINIIAHIDVDEAKAELLARLSHAKIELREAIDDRKLPDEVRKSLRRAAIIEGKADFKLDEPDWGNGYIGKILKKHRNRCRALLDEKGNPYARAFYFPQGYSRPFVTDQLNSIWADKHEALKIIDRRYVPIEFGGSASIGKKDIPIAMVSAAALIESPNPVSFCRALALPKRHLRQAPLRNKGSPPAQKLRNNRKVLR